MDSTSKYKKNMKSKMFSFIKIIFFIYIVALFTLVVFKFQGSFSQLQDTRNDILGYREEGFWNYNLTPFRTISIFLRNFTDSYAFINIMGNIIPFIPLGFFVPLLFVKKRQLINTLLISFVSILLIEILQFITMLGFFDIDDIILNMIGCIMGYVMFLILKVISGRRR